MLRGKIASLIFGVLTSPLYGSSTDLKPMLCMVSRNGARIVGIPGKGIVWIGPLKPRLSLLGVLERCDSIGSWKLMKPELVVL